jgi:hypothetical protein
LLDRDAALARLEESVCVAAAALGIDGEVDLSDLENALIVAIAVESLTAPSIINVEARTLLDSGVSSAYWCWCGILSGCGAA